MSSSTTISTAIKSIHPFLPPLELKLPNSFSWPNPQITDTLKLVTKSSSSINNGKKLFAAISKIRGYLPFNSKDRLAKSASKGFAKFFDELLPRNDKERWFEHFVPRMADLVLRLPSILESHYSKSDRILSGVYTGLRILEPQQSGIVFLNQSPWTILPIGVVRSIHDSYHAKQENKLKCIIHYFERICSSTPSNYVSFERKVLSPEQKPSVVALPPSDFWANSDAPLCKFKVFNTGKIEQHPAGSLEVDFADEYIGGLVLTKGCVQEEIRFMMNPELIAGMLFLPSMSENEAIEIVGAERFSNYKGYNASFQYDGDYIDKRELDSLRRRISGVIAIDALRRAGTRQYKNDFLLREVNKAYCGFLDHTRYLQQDVPDSKVGIVTGNWGCGIFGGDPQIKSIIQWAAASQASRPFVAYYTFGLDKVRNLDQVVQWIVSQNWTVGDLWSKFSEYCSERASGGTKLGFFPYLLPSLNQDSGSGSKATHRRGASAGASRGRPKRGS